MKKRLKNQTKSWWARRVAVILPDGITSSLNWSRARNARETSFLDDFQSTNAHVETIGNPKRTMQTKTMQPQKLTFKMKRHQQTKRANLHKRLQRRFSLPVRSAPRDSAITRLPFTSFDARVGPRRRNVTLIFMCCLV